MKSWNSLPINATEIIRCVTTDVNAYSQGCYERLANILSSYRTYFIIGVIIVGAIEVLALVFTIFLYHRKKRV
jgi:hypothetical protein